MTPLTETELKQFFETVNKSSPRFGAGKNVSSTGFWQVRSIVGCTQIFAGVGILIVAYFVLPVFTMNPAKATVDALIEQASKTVKSLREPPADGGEKHSLVDKLHSEVAAVHEALKIGRDRGVDKKATEVVENAIGITKEMKDVVREAVRASMAVQEDYRKFQLTLSNGKPTFTASVDVGVEFFGVGAVDGQIVKVRKNISFADYQLMRENSISQLDRWLGSIVSDDDMPTWLNQELLERVKNDDRTVSELDTVKVKAALVRNHWLQLVHSESVGGRDGVALRPSLSLHPAFVFKAEVPGDASDAMKKDAALFRQVAANCDDAAVKLSRAMSILRTDDVAKVDVAVNPTPKDAIGAVSRIESALETWRNSVGNFSEFAQNKDRFEAAKQSVSDAEKRLGDAATSLQNASSQLERLSAWVTYPGAVVLALIAIMLFSAGLGNISVTMERNERNGDQAGGMSFEERMVALTGALLSLGVDPTELSRILASKQDGDGGSKSADGRGGGSFSDVVSFLTGRAIR